MKTNRNKMFAAVITAYGIDLKKDFFSLTDSEINCIDDIRRGFKYSGRNYLGRSKVRQFWYAAQRGAK